MYGSGCPRCVTHPAKLTKDLVNIRLENKDIYLVGEYVNAKTKSLFECLHGHQWLTTPDNILRGRGCPRCTEYGFNPSKPAWEYAFIRDGYLKYGITNDLTRRLSEHILHGEFTLVHQCYHEVGQGALEWENRIKKTYGGRYATKEQCPDGYTETLSIILLEKIIILA
jgi:hypothetical protein